MDNGVECATTRSRCVLGFVRYDGHCDGKKLVPSSLRQHETICCHHQQCEEFCDVGEGFFQSKMGMNIATKNVIVMKRIVITLQKITQFIQIKINRSPNFAK